MAAGATPRRSHSTPTTAASSTSAGTNGSSGRSGWAGSVDSSVRSQPCSTPPASTRRAVPVAGTPTGSSSAATPAAPPSTSPRGARTAARRRGRRQLVGGGDSGDHRQHRREQGDRIEDRGERQARGGGGEQQPEPARPPGAVALGLLPVRPARRLPGNGVPPAHGHPAAPLEAPNLTLAFPEERGRGLCSRAAPLGDPDVTFAHLRLARGGRPAVIGAPSRSSAAGPSPRRVPGSSAGPRPARPRRRTLRGRAEDLPRRRTRWPRRSAPRAPRRPRAGAAPTCTNHPSPSRAPTVARSSAAVVSCATTQSRSAAARSPLVPGRTSTTVPPVVASRAGRSCSAAAHSSDATISTAVSNASASSASRRVSSTTTHHGCAGSTYSRTISCPVRAVAFQCRCRSSSPGTYEAQRAQVHRAGHRVRRRCALVVVPRPAGLRQPHRVAARVHPHVGLPAGGLAAARQAEQVGALDGQRPDGHAAAPGGRQLVAVARRPAGRQRPHPDRPHLRPDGVQRGEAGTAAVRPVADHQLGERRLPDVDAVGVHGPGHAQPQVPRRRHERQRDGPERHARQRPQERQVQQEARPEQRDGAGEHGGAARGQAHGQARRDVEWAAGWGVAPSTSSSTSPAVRLFSSASGVSTIRCASTACATSLMSSGVTNDRSSIAAAARAAGHQRDAAARARPVADGRVLARRRGQPHRVAGDLRVDVQPPHLRDHRTELGKVEDGGELRRGRCRRPRRAPPAPRRRGRGSRRRPA